MLVLAQAIACLHVLTQAVGCNSESPKIRSKHPKFKHLEPFPWNELTSNKNLKWRDCYSQRQCARLNVPLDHSAPERGTIEIALMRIPSSFPPNSESYRGPILFNPGGPGGSGIGLIQTRGEFLRSIVGPEFDIVGFDPRGLGHSTPRASLFKTDVERAFWYSNSGAVNTSNEGVARTWARAHLLGQLAAENDKGFLSFINSEQTARDMLTIVEAHGRSKLQYWGFSYGTVLGVTFASIFPDKVERLILDSVVDADSFFGNKWSNKLADTWKVMDLFFSECAEAGPDRCAFWASTAEEIRQKLHTLFRSIQSQPVPVKLESSYGLVDYDALRVVIFKLLKSPYTSFPSLAQGLAELATGDGRWILEKYFELNIPPYQHQCNLPGEEPDTGDDTGTVVTCNDHVALPEDIKWAQDYYSMMLNASEWGDVWSRYLMECQGWPKFPKSDFRGPFQGNTSHPILLINNAIDPATPLAFAHKMSARFPASVVLTQNAAGHLSIVSSSSCTHFYIRRYFLDGTLPQPGTVCQVNGTFFPDENLYEQTDTNQYPFFANI